MTVRRILESKPITKILTIEPSQTISEATEMLSANRVGALIVSHGGDTLDGVLSERDIVRELGRQGTKILDMMVSDLMTTDITTAKPGDTSVMALDKMTKGRFRHLPVIEDAQMIGVISIGDVVKYRMEEMAHENSALTDMIVGHG